VTFDIVHAITEKKMGDHVLYAPVALQFQWLSPTALFVPSYPNQQLHPHQPTVREQDKKD